MSIQTAASNMKTRVTQWESWVWGLVNAFVIGGFTSLGSWFGMAAAHGSGLDVPALNWKAVGVIFISGAGVRFCAYMAQGLPSLTQTSETSYFKQNPDGSTVAQSSKTVIDVPAEPKPPTS